MTSLARPQTQIQSVHSFLVRNNVFVVVVVAFSTVHRKTTIPSIPDHYIGTHDIFLTNEFKQKWQVTSGPKG